jgi:prepilin-type N-terminal cleavage/methylation domain-containing protein
MSNQRRNQSHKRGTDRRGFTIVEVIVAIMILAIGVLGLAATSGVVTRQLGRGNLQTIASTVAQSRFDSLASVPCAGLAPTAGVNQTGSANTRGIRESWVISDSNDMKAIVDTVRFTGRTNALVYVSLIPCRD